MDLQTLRQKYPVFEYKSYKYDFDNDGLNIEYLFANQEFEFRPTLKFLKAKPYLDKYILENFIFHIGLVEMFSYWKAFCSPKIKISAGELNEDQISWWKGLLTHGMGQYFYENRIDFTTDKSISIETSGNQFDQLKHKVLGEKVLVPLGGGKDSIVTLETLKAEFDVSAFALNPIPAVEETIKVSEISSQVIVKRQLDPKLLKLNEQGFLNGHTPFSALVAFLSVFGAALFEYKHVALSNERSSDEGNTRYLDTDINHQYSKTFEFEKLFREYNKQYLSDINYFSFLRPLYEIQIVKLFSTMEKYFDTVKSCNVGRDTNSWCCSCPKCLSTFILLYPFLGAKRILNIFPQNMFENESLKSMVDELIDEDKVKPFECVGTREELKLALSLAIKKTDDLPELLIYAKGKLNGYEPNIGILEQWNKQNFLEDKFAEVLELATK